jgi:hypothetical protein
LSHKFAASPLAQTLQSHGLASSSKPFKTDISPPHLHASVVAPAMIFVNLRGYEYFDMDPSQYWVEQPHIPLTPQFYHALRRFHMSVQERVAKLEADPESLKYNWIRQECFVHQVSNKLLGDICGAIETGAFYPHGVNKRRLMVKKN